MKLLLGLAILALISNIWCEHDYVLDHESFEAIEGDEETLLDFSQVKCIRRERLFNGSFTMAEDLDDDAFKFGAEMYSSSSGNSNYKKIGLDIPKTGACEAFKKFYVQFVQPAMRSGENTNLPEVPDDGLCPFPGGTYYIKEIAMNTEKWPSSVPRGTLKVVAKFYKNEAFVGGFNMFLRVQDK